MKTTLLCCLLFAAAWAAPSAKDLRTRVIRLEVPPPGAPLVDPRMLRSPDTPVPIARGARTGADSPRIVGGREARPGEFPYQAALSINGNTFCGGSLIHQRWVLTAAHCVDKATSVRATLGTIDRTSSGNGRLDVWADLVALAGYDPSKLENDIAMLRFPEPIPLSSNIGLVSLASSGCDSSIDGQIGVPTGWGRSSDSSSDLPTILRTVDVKIISNDECGKVYANIVQTKVCSRAASGTVGGVCSGDSGGPMVLQSNRQQVGINSWVAAAGCEQPLPHGYTRVPCFYDWIQSVIRDLTDS